MYHYLSRSVKKRIMETLRFCFDSNPQHRDVVKHIREKYEFSERPQKGIVLQNSSSTPLSLSSDNFMGTLHSYLMLAHVDSHRGAALEWVREDDRAIQANGGDFPSEPGVYYIEIEGITPAGGVPQFQFWVDPLLTVLEEPIIEFQTGNETTAILANAPVLENSVSLYQYPDSLLFSGKAVHFSADQSLFIGGGTGSPLLLGHKEGYIRASKTGDLAGPYTIVAGTNDVFEIQINDNIVTVMLPAGNLTPADVADAIEAETIASGIDYTTYEIDVVSDAVKITATQSLFIEDESISTANTTLGFQSGYVPVQATGIMVQPHVPEDSTFRAVVDGTPLQISLLAGNRTVDAIIMEIEQAFAATSLVADVVPGGDYSLDPQTGDITFLHGFDPGTRIIADYRYPTGSRGPFPLGTGEVSNTDAIPGAVLAFGTALEDGDVMAVVVEEKRSDVADVYGGKFDVSLDLDVFARDSMTRSQLADLIVMYLWQWRRERLAEEGIIIQNVSFGGESEEPYDDTGDDYYYLASISLTLMTDWEIHIEKPLFIKRIIPTSFDYDARMAASKNGYLLERPDRFQITDPNRLEQFARLYVVDQAGGFERIR